MTHAGAQTNGASLEDCHANFFALTDVCGIKWIVFRENACPSSTASCESAGDDAVLSSFARCLEADLLAVWRRVPKRALLTTNYDMSGNPIKSGLSPREAQAYEEKNPITQRKELWIFWYGDKPDDLFKRLVSKELKEVSDISGTWENVLPYEARTLLYKALNNLIERNLLSKDFVRLGKWFVQPFEGPEKTLQKASHLSFSFHYFVHGESYVCASVDVRQHPAVRRLSPDHLALARGGTTPVQVILAPYGMAGTLTGVSYKSSDPNVGKLLKDWDRFYPLDKNKYYCQDNMGDMVAMSPAVEVVVAGVKLIYPTSYVLTTDLDSPHHHNFGGHQAAASAKSVHTCRTSGDFVKSEVFNSVEPSPFTTSNHPLLCEGDYSASAHLPLSIQSEIVWQDGLTVNPENNSSQTTSDQHAKAGDNNSSVPQSASELLSCWELSNPGRFVKKKPKSRLSSREKSKDRNRFNSKVPFHKKAEALDELAWALDQSEMLGNNSNSSRTGQSGGSNSANNASSSAANNNNNNNASNSTLGTNNKVQVSMVSPAGSVGGPRTPMVMTPKAPGSVRTPGGDLMSPHQPPSNGPLTPIDMDSKQPSTPKSVPSYPVPSPFTAGLDKKPPVVELNIKSEQATNGVVAAVTQIANTKGDEEEDLARTTSQVPYKRPALPTKEYEEDLLSEENLSDNIFDKDSLRHWLNHPVKRFKPTESRSGDPLRPMYRRNSQSDLVSPELNSLDSKDLLIKQENVTASGKQNGNNDPYEFSDGHDKRENGGAKNSDDDKTDLFTIKGLEPSINDLDNLFDDSSDETEGNGVVPTPPGSNKPATASEDQDTAFTKIKSVSKVDPTGNLPHDQLAKMFPTPPSHEHNALASPADGTADVDHHIKVEPASPAPDRKEWLSCEDVDYMLASSKFKPLHKLYSDDFPPINLPVEFKYKPQRRFNQPTRGNVTNVQSFSGPNSVSTPLGTPGGLSNKPGLSPGSPMNSVDGPRSHHGPGSVGGANYNASHSPASVSSNYESLSVEPPLSSATSGQQQVGNKSTASVGPEASSLLLTLVLSDTLLNVFRDHNFDSCTMCVCSNEGNIRGRDAPGYLPNSSGDDDVNCICGFSAVMNRTLAHQSGLFYEDETEVTGITEDLYHRKKTSLLLLDPKYDSNNSSSENLADRANVVDAIPPQLLELIQEQSVYNQSSQNALIKYTKQYLKVTNQPPAISMVDLMDSNYVAFVTLEHVKNFSSSSTNEASAKLDQAQKGTCVHRWTLMQAAGPYCSEDIVRVMKSLQPILNDSLHVKKSTTVGQKDATTQSVQGPLTWRQFHRMAGPSTKGNTDDQCEPLPVPAVTVGHEKDFLSLAPQALHYWDSLSLEPFSQQRDVAYIVVAPEGEFILGRVRTFFKNLSCVYETCRLGRHVPITKVLRDGILKVGKNAADKLTNDGAEPWFEMIGESPTATLLKLYSQVCRQYLTPLLRALPLDKSLMDASSSSPPQSPMPPPNMSNHENSNSNSGLPSMGDFKLNSSKEEDSGSNKENMGSSTFNEANTADDCSDGDVPAVVIYMIDPFSFGAENCDLMRLSTLGLLRSFSQMMPHMGDVLKNNVYLQLVSLETVLEMTQCKQQSRMPSMMRGLAFSVHNQARRPLHYQRECKTLTGFGPASSSEKYLKVNEEKAKFTRKLHCPSFVLAPPSVKRKTSDSDSFGASNERSSVLFCNYCLSEDQHWLLASCCDDRGELVKTVIINIEIPNKTRRKKASARRVGLRKFMDWILSVMAMSLVPWRLVIGRIGRIGHGELRGWSVLLSRKALKRASKQLRELCNWQSDVPSILSACLVSMEPDSRLRLMSDQYTPDERFGQTASNCQLSTPKDASCTHVLVFPTSAKVQSSQKTFEDHQDVSAGNDLDIGLDDLDMDTGEEGIGIGNIDEFKDLFNDDNWGGGGGQPGSPGSPKRNSMSRSNSPSSHNTQERGDQFKYGQEEPDERIEILQQPLALGYMVSTAKTGPMPRWFWASCPHLEHTCPVFLKSALHINVASLMHGGDDGFTPQAASGRVHSLDSSYTADVLRYVLEGYNALSWLSMDFERHDRRSCLPMHVQILLQMYNSLAALV